MGNAELTALIAKRSALLQFHSGRANRLSVTLWLTALLAGIFLTNCIFAAKTSGLGALVPLGAVVTWGLSRLRQRVSNEVRLANGLKQPFAEEYIYGAASITKRFVLYLRSFDVERAQVSDRGWNDDVSLRDSTVAARDVEALALEMLDLPSIALADPRDPMPMAGAYRFSTVPLDWEDQVRTLSRQASIVIMYVGKLTNGIIQEFEILREEDCWSKLVLIAEPALEGVLKQHLAEFPALGARLVAKNDFSSISEINYQQLVLNAVKFSTNDQFENLIRKPMLLKSRHPTMLRRILDFLHAPMLVGLGAATYLWAADQGNLDVDLIAWISFFAIGKVCVRIWLQNFRKALHG